ncbi:sensor histidine kinase [uncultured Clostridium sp.]|uniref:sensor histidine kinase n=1 Tax=uncultured Clostridium sp. TaxID=59620 RepID=UPI0028E23FF6|nr:sensor histidine kinase [uncultured Clostridium sp.]
MVNFKKCIIASRLVLLLSIFISIYFHYSSYILIMILLFSVTSIVIINDYIRIFKLKDQSKYVSISVLISILATAVLQHSMPGIRITICMYSLLFEIFQLEKKLLKFFLPTHWLLYFLISISNGEIYSGHGNIYLSLGINLLSYFGTSGMLYNQKVLEAEKEEIKQLNEKLKLANIKLHEYSLKIEEVAISNERTRVSQELHDSLGHSLMALAMHLEFAKKIFTTKPEKVEDVLLQSEKIAKSSINDLREAVTLLNSDYEIKDFDTSIDKLIHNFYLFSNLKITLNKNQNINDLTPIVKTSIYKTIQESITNSLKHGNSTEINIKVKVNNQNLELIITDNGIGCNNIIKSNGLNGIENRINSLGGTTYYFSYNNLGFGIRMFIPI